MTDVKNPGGMNTDRFFMSVLKLDKINDIYSRQNKLSREWILLYMCSISMIKAFGLYLQLIQKKKDVVHLKEKGCEF